VPAVTGDAGAAHHLAQFNVARLRAPLDAPEIADFVDNLEPVNALAEGAPGFVWRLQTDEGDATAIRVFDDDMIIVNLGVWESVETLADFAYRSDHRHFLRRRREWFERMAEAYLVLWWVPAGYLPTVDEAVTKLEHIRENGPSPDGFTFKSPFPPPAAIPAIGE
jgi:hypothetical protein